MKGPLVVAVALSLSIVPATTARATFPGSNGKIVYEEPPTPAHRQLFVMQPDGSGRTSITSNRRDNFSPVWSPDGTKVAFGRSWFSRKNGRHGFLEMKNADGSGRTIIRRIDFLIDITWSPDGSSLAFTSAVSAQVGQIHIFTVHVDGTHLRDITKNHGVESDSGPAWSPDGTKIAFSANGNGRRRMIETISPDGSLRTIIVPRGENDSPDWSPDGTKIVFQRTTNRGPSTEIFVVNVDGTGLKNLTSTPTRYEWTPVFSPDGTKILFSKGRVNPRSNDLWTMNLDGSSPVGITTTQGFGEYNADWQPI